MREYRVLIVEDDPLFSSYLETILESVMTAELVVVTSLAAAKPALEMPVDVAFLDVEMLDGRTYGLAAALQEAGVPYTFLTASNRDEVPASLRTASFIVKPYGEADVRRFLASCDLASRTFAPRPVRGRPFELGS